MLNFAFTDVQCDRWFACRGCSTPFEKDGVLDDCFLDLALLLSQHLTWRPANRRDRAAVSLAQVSLPL
jgi:hypothetical protein